MLVTRVVASIVTWLVAAAVGMACSTGGDGNDGAPGGDTGPSTEADGGAGNADAASGRACSKPADCPSKICKDGVCAPPAPNDGVQNGDETDVDCGGSAPKCDVQKKCAAGGDCTSGVCNDVGQGAVCQAPAPDDGVKNGDETDVDCGGAKAPKCPDGKACGARADCASDVCPANVCAQAVCDDGAKNGTETDVDCGGPGCPRCGTGATCAGTDDCQSSVCKDVGAGPKCQAPSPTDGVKNGDESDVDCGGLAAPKCGVGLGCKVHADCRSDGCDYDGKCALRRSCTPHYGGDTCGAGGPGGQGAAAWESCCATAPAGAGGVAMDKYKITSGRMRAFMERTNGDVRAAIRTLRAAGRIPSVPGDPAHSLMPASWDLYLPTSMEGCDKLGTCDTHPDGAGGTDVEISDHFYQDATNFKGIYSSGYRHLGASLWRTEAQSQQGCRVAAPGTHSYWMNAATQTDYFGDIAAEYGQTDYDPKPINCTTYVMLQAFCIWDGGRLETTAEWLAAIGPTTFPWGNAPAAWGGVGSSTYYAARFPDATDATSIKPPPAGSSIEYANYTYSYEYPHQVQFDYIVFLNAPGRLPKGKGPQGHSDLAYTMFEMTSNVTSWNADPTLASVQWADNGSWEGHGYGKSSFGEPLLDKYGKMSGRCVYP